MNQRFLPGADLPSRAAEPDSNGETGRLTFPSPQTHYRSPITEGPPLSGISPTAGNRYRRNFSFLPGDWPRLCIGAKYELHRNPLLGPIVRIGTVRTAPSSVVLFLLEPFAAATWMEMNRSAGLLDRRRARTPRIRVASVSRSTGKLHSTPAPDGWQVTIVPWRGFPHPPNGVGSILQIPPRKPESATRNRVALRCPVLVTGLPSTDRAMVCPSSLSQHFPAGITLG